MSCEVNLGNQLRERGYRITPQRSAILHVLGHTQGHLTPAEVYQQASINLPSLTETTVYRTLEFLAKTGLAQAVFSEKSKYAYEISGYAHHHLICRQCGMEIEVPQVKTEALYKELQESTGFQLFQNQISFFGLCPACQKDQE